MIVLILFVWCIYHSPVVVVGSVLPQSPPVSSAPQSSVFAPTFQSSVAVVVVVVPWVKGPGEAAVGNGGADASPCHCQQKEAHMILPITQ